MSIDIHEEPWLRDALSDIVGTEPAMASTLVDDLRRGEAARTIVRRQRIVAVAVAAVLALVAVPAGFLLRAQPHASPSAATISATPGSVEETLRQRATDWLAAAGWAVLTQHQPTITDGTGRTEIDFDVARSSDVAAGGSESTSLRLVSYPHGSAPGYYLATCTNESCPEAQQVAATTSCTGRPDCFIEAGAYPRAVGGTLSWGSLVLDRQYESGVLVEIAVETDYRVPTPATGTTPGAFLSLEQTRSVLAAVGNPYAASPVLSQSPRPVLPPTTDGFVADDKWEIAVISAYAGGMTAILQHADLTASALTVSGRELEGDVGRFAQTQVRVGAGATSQLLSPPCLPDDPRCVVLLPWGKVTTAQGPAWINVVDISFDQPTHRTRVATVVRGDTLLTVTSDSREVSVDFTYGVSTAPGLAPDIIVERALAMPLPESMRTAAGRPMATPPGAGSGPGGSASASATSGTGGPQTAQDRAFAESVPCGRDQVNVTYSGADGATGLNIYTFLVRNVTQKPCGLVGRATVTIPGLALRYAAGSGSFAGSDPAVVTVFLLQPGATADFSATKWRCDYGTGARASTIDIRVNSAAVPTSLAFDGTTQCTGGPASDPGNVLTVYGWHGAH